MKSFFKKDPERDRRILLILFSPFIFIALCMLISVVSVVAIWIITAMGHSYHVQH